MGTRSLAPSEGITLAGPGPLVRAKPFHDDTSLAAAVATAAVFMALIQIGMVMNGGAPVLDGVLVDPDAYMRLARVEHLWASGAWFDPVFPRIGPPDGLAMHWTRPFDVVLLMGALIASPLLGFKTGLFWWGVALGPVLQVTAVVALLWAAAPLLPRAWRALLAFLFIAQPAVFGSFAIGRPDHHGLQALLFILLIGFTLRSILAPVRWRAALWAGLVSVLAVWVSVESILAVALSIAALGLAWLFGEPRALRGLLTYALTLCLGLLAVLFMERGAGALIESETDRVSAAHLSLFLLNLAFWLSLSLLERRRLGGRGVLARAGVAGVLGAAALGLLWLLQPGLFADPMANGDALYMAKHMANIEELQPAFELADSFDGAWYEYAAKPLLWLGLVLLAGPWLLLRLVTTAGRERLAWAYITLGVAVFLPLAVARLRWAFYPELLLLIPYAGFAGAALERLAARLPASAIGVARPLLVVSLCIWYVIPTVASDSSPHTGAAVRTAAACPIRSLAPVLNDPEGLGARPRTLLAFIDLGPELLYRTPHAVLAIPNHRYQPGFATGYRIMTASDMSAAERALRGAGVDLLLLCPGSAEAWFYDTEDDARTLNEALREGDPPAFLRALALPAPLSEQFKLFAVRATGE